MSYEKDDPVEYPILDGGPGIVDSMTTVMREIRDGRQPPPPGWTAENLGQSWIQWAKFPVAYQQQLKDRGITYWILEADQPSMDFPPGKNRVSLFDDVKSRSYEGAMLDRFNSSVRYLGSTPIIELMNDRADVEPPYVLKDPFSQQGEGKLLVEDHSQHAKVISYLRSRRRASIAGLLTEPFIETPSQFSTTFRINATPSGRIHSAAIARSLSAKSTVKATARDSGRNLARLVEEGNPYFIDTHRIASNIEGDKTYIGLDFDGRWYEMTSPTETDQQVLSNYDIDPDNPRLPDRVKKAAVDVARILGPGTGLHVGIDLIMGRDGLLHLLETNNNPAYTSIFETRAKTEPPISMDDIRARAFWETVEDLEAGLFAETTIAA